MEQILTVPEGFELKKISDNQYSIVEKEQETKDYANSLGSIKDIQRQQMQDAVTRHRNSFFNRKDNRNNYDFDDELFESRDREQLWERRFANIYDSNGDIDYSRLQQQRDTFRHLYEQGRIKKLSAQEMNLLRFCHGIDVKGFLKEEFDKNPIIVTRDEDGIMHTELPNSFENLGKTDPTKFLKKD